MVGIFGPRSYVPLSVSLGVLLLFGMFIKNHVEAHDIYRVPRRWKRFKVLNH